MPILLHLDPFCNSHNFLDQTEKKKLPFWSEHLLFSLENFLITVFALLQWFMSQGLGICPNLDKSLCPSFKNFRTVISNPF
jgi:hypothetical protein